LKLAQALRVALGLLILGGASPAAAAETATLVITGGINATIKLTPANCVAGPGASLTVNDVSGGGWDSLDLYAVDPAPGSRGTAEVDLNGSGFTKAPYAIDDWIWKGARRGHIVKPLTVAANGTTGSIDLVAPVSDTFLGPKTSAVRIKVTWHAGTCKAFVSR
jgi:hypothetical protein